MDDRYLDLLKAYLTSNAVPVQDLPEAIKHLRTVFEPLENKPVPAVPVEKSVTDEFIICLEDGKPLKLLRRYLRDQFGMAVEEYREKWGLPEDYPVVARNYSKQRSSLAKAQKLGQRPSNT